MAVGDHLTYVQTSDKRHCRTTVSVYVGQVTLMVHMYIVIAHLRCGMTIDKFWAFRFERFG